MSNLIGSGGCLFLSRSLFVLCLFFSTTSLAADIDWEGWSFDWSTDDSSSGLVLTDVGFNGEKILAKASMPVMRVEYLDDVCGPYADILSPYNLRRASQGAPNSSCNNQSVCTREFTRAGERMLEVGSNWQIGEYQIYQTYYFSEQGYIDARVYSRGLQCQIDHSHHPHWMFDFDIGDSDNDTIFADGQQRINEFNDQKTATNQWIIRDKVTQSAVRLVPSADDGVPDNFSQWDVAGRAYQSVEVARWRHGARGEIGDLYSNGENLDGNDIVFWYVAHLSHSASEGSNIWHASGPRIEVISTDSPEPEPEPEPEPPVQPPEPGNLLVNGGFEQGKAGWFDCGAEQNTVADSASVASGTGSMRIVNGGCLYQEIPANAGDEMTLSCEADRNGAAWTIMELSFSDASYNVLATNTAQISSQNGFVNYQKSAIAPASSSYAVVVLYSEDETYFDDCRLELGNTIPVPPPNQANNLLSNGDFENSLASWQSCASANLVGLSADASSGEQALTINSGGCLYQEFPVNSGDTYSLACQAKRDGSAYTSLRLAMLGSDYSALASDDKVITSNSYQTINASAAASSDASIGVAVLYSEDPAHFDNCVVSTQ